MNCQRGSSGAKAPGLVLLFVGAEAPTPGTRELGGRGMQREEG